MKCALVTFWNYDMATLLPQLSTFDYIFVCEQAAFDLLELHVELEAIVSDFDTVSYEQLLQKYPTERYIKLPAEKDMTDTSALLQYVQANYQPTVITVFNSFDKRADHLLALLSLFSIMPKLIIKTPTSKIQFLTADTHEILPNNRYRYISFIALTPVKDISITGFRYPLRKEVLEPFSDLTVSNEWQDNKPGIVSFTVGRLLVIFANDSFCDL